MVVTLLLFLVFDRLLLCRTFLIRPGFGRIQRRGLRSFQPGTEPPTTVDIDSRTSQCLDFADLLVQVSSCTRTNNGSELAFVHAAEKVEGAKLNYDKVRQIGHHVETMPGLRKMDVGGLLTSLANNTGIVSLRELAQFVEDLSEIEDLRLYLTDSLGTLSLFQDTASEMQLPCSFIAEFSAAFDTDGQLSDDKYPKIRNLRRQVVTTRASVVASMYATLQSPSLAGKLTDT
jgi:dsDNA-specific endonuclease/ATPase MutS2